jgi:hypothetical protein
MSLLLQGWSDHIAILLLLCLFSCFSNIVIVLLLLILRADIQFRSLLLYSSEDPGERGIIKFGQQFYLKTLPGIGGDVRYQLPNLHNMRMSKYANIASVN